MNLRKVTFAKHDRAHVLAPGLFRSLKKGTNSARPKLDVTYEYDDDRFARFIGFSALGVPEMCLLQVLVALGGPSPLLIDTNSTSHTSKQLRLFLDPRDAAAQADLKVVQSSMNEMLELMGKRKGGTNIKSVKESLIRLANVTVVAHSPDGEASFHLLSHTVSESGLLHVALNPRITDAIMGRAQHTRIELAEVRELSTDAARLIHQRLCGWIDPGGSGTVGTDKLIEYAYPPTENETSPLGRSQRSMRRSRTRKAIAELSKAGWTVRESSSDVWQIQRPRQQSIDAETS